MALEYAEQHPDVLWQALDRGLRARPPKSFPYLNLAAHLIDTKDDLVPIAQVRDFVRAVVATVLSVMTDHDQRSRFVDSMRRIVPSELMNASPVDTQPADAH